MAQQPVVIGGTYDWFLNPALINTEAAPSVFGIWDITSATITITFIAPDGTKFHFTGTVVSGSAGQARYINATTLFTVEGQWGVSWKVSLSGTVLESAIVYFPVLKSGAA